MRSEKELVEALASARARYQETVATRPIAESYDLSTAVNDLMEELSQALSEGAEPCIDCGAEPHGAHARSTPLGERYTVACLACGQKEAHGGSAEVAVENWNSGHFVRRNKDNIYESYTA